MVDRAQDLSGRTAVVTGASRGIGLATAGALVGAGANVILTSRHADAADDAAATLDSDRAVGYQAHSADEDAAHACIEFAISRFGSLDILINNAGTNPAFGPVVDQDKGRFMKTLEINLWAPVLWTGIAWHSYMREHGGVIVNTASVGGLMVGPNLGTYHASKAALIHITKQLALELAPMVRVNAVAPGVVRTRLAEVLVEDHGDEVATSTPLGRLGEPVDVSRAIAFLASDAAEWITGETLVIDGGQLLSPSTAIGSGGNV